MHPRVSTGSLLSNATATGAGASAGPAGAGRKTFQATVAGTGSVYATIDIEVSNDNSNWMTMGTITLSGTTSATDGFVSDEPWAYHRANVTAISGTSATVNVIATGG